MKLQVAMADAEAQEDEILALQSILEESQFVIEDEGNNVIRGVLYCTPEINNQMTVVSGKAEPAEGLLQLSVAYLPPIALNFSLPADYPSLQPPLFTLSCPYLSLSQVEMFPVSFTVLFY